MDKGVVFSDVTWRCHPTPQRLALEAGLHSGYRLQLVWGASLGLWAAVVFRGRPVIHAAKFRQMQGFEKNEGNISGGALWYSQEVLYVTQPPNAKTDILFMLHHLQFRFSVMPTPPKYFEVSIPHLEKGSKHVTKYNVGWWAPTCLQLLNRLVQFSNITDRSLQVFMTFPHMEVIKQYIN